MITAGDVIQSDAYPVLPCTSYCQRWERQTNVTAAIHTEIQEQILADGSNDRKIPASGESMYNGQAQVGIVSLGT